MVSSWFFVASLAVVAFSAHGQTFPPTQDIVFDNTEPPEATTSVVIIEDPTTADVIIEDSTTADVIIEDPTTAEVTTEAPTTPEATTEAPTTLEATTVAPTTPFITTSPPTKPPKKRKVVLVFVDDLESDYAGAASLSAKATFDSENDGAFTFNDFNLHFQSVPADLLTNDDYYSSTRSLGFAARLGSVNVTNDCRGLEAQIEGSAHSGIYEALDSHRFFVNAPNDENYYAPNQLVDTTAMVSVDSEEGDGMLLDRLYDLSMTKPTNETLHIKVHIKIVLWIGPSSAQRRLGILPLKIVLWKVIWVKILILPCPNDLFPFPFTLKRRLCIQPIRIQYSTTKCLKTVRRGWWWNTRRRCTQYETKLSGAGLPFGQPGAIAEWDKVDIEFEFREWKTVSSNAYAVVRASEEFSLRKRVDDADCIEVFFVPKFSPSNLHGGGATWGVGVEGAKVITSDEQVNCSPGEDGVDLTHLAHQLGLVLGLRHPGDVNGGSTGTLMCPSGWKNDNPKRNSEENGMNVVQPLLKWAIVPGEGGTPDCKNSEDCGPCVTGPAC